MIAFFRHTKKNRFCNSQRKLDDGLGIVFFNKQDAENVAVEAMESNLTML